MHSLTIVKTKLVTQQLCIHSDLELLPCKLYYRKYMLASTQITNAEVFPFTAVIFYKLLKFCFV